MFSFKFLEISSKSITSEKIVDVIESAPRKICFNSCHKGALRKQDHEVYKGAFNLPFKDSIAPFFERETSLRLFEKDNGKAWHSIRSEEDFSKIEGFVKNFKEIVFIRDCLELSIALCENFDEDDERTEIGELEYQAKFKDDEEAKKALIKKCIECFDNLPFYKDADFICAIPPSKKGGDNLPRLVAEGLASAAGLKNISKSVEWKKDKPQLKEVKFDDKLKLLEDIGVEIVEDVKGKNIILVDDLYQSGVTMQYCAMKLKEAGAKRVFGFSIVKSRSNTDNS